MKAISVRAPWPWAILYAGKGIENRSRKDGKMPAMCRYRGPLLIHASAWWDAYEVAFTFKEYIRDIWRETEHGKAHAGPLTPNMIGEPRGGIVGRAVAIGTVYPDGSYVSTPGLRGPTDMRWHAPGSYGLILADVEPLPFVPWKGALGLFEVPDEVVARAIAAAEAT